MLPILHLNGYKIGGPTVLGRMGDDDIVSLLRGHGWEPHVVAGDDPVAMHPRFAQVLDDCHAGIRAIQAEARRPGADPARAERPRWPAIVLRTPKGWTGPKTVDGLPVEGTFRAHQVPVDRVREDPAHLAILEALDAELPAGGALRRRRAAPGRAGRARAHGRASPRRESPRQRRPPPASARPARLRRLRAAGAAARRPSCTAPPASSGSSCATSSPATARPPTSASSARTRPTRTGSATCSRWRTAARCCPGRPTTTTWRRTAG